MMDAVREYLLSVTAAAVICAVLRNILGEKGTAAGVLKLVCGLFLAFTVIRPVAEVELDELALFTADIYDDAQAAVSAGEEFAQESLASIIKAETEAYILDKAKTYGADLRIEVTVSDDPQPLPVEVRLTGNISPYGKTELQSLIVRELGISKENQIWIG